MISPEAAYDPEKVVRDVEETRRLLRDQLADMDPGHVVLILQNLLRPACTGRRYFLRQVADGVHVP